MELAVVKADIAPLFEDAGKRMRRADEVLMGMVVEMLEVSTIMCKVRTRYGYEGKMPADFLVRDSAAAAEWESYGKLVVRAPFVDVLAGPEMASSLLVCVPRGGLLHPLGEVDAEGWLQVGLPGGVEGYVKGGNLMPLLTDWHKRGEEQQREALATTALSYLGSQYRYGGKTPLGMDAGGLVSMAYLLNGAAIWRGAEYREGFGLGPVDRALLGRGDVIYFEGHCALYLGDDMYVHATAQNGSDGVVLNSLRPDSPFYRADLAEGVTTCASLYG